MVLPARCSPELMVTPVYDAAWPGGVERGQALMAAAVQTALPQLHSLVVGPGLGRDPGVLAAVGSVLAAAAEGATPVVVDADGLWLVAQEPGLVRGNANVILTPNAREYARLCEAVLGPGKAKDPLLKAPLLGADSLPAAHEAEAEAEADRLKALCTALGHVTVVKKGSVDLVSDGHSLLECAAEGCPRRCGGIGDVLAGTLGVLAAWSKNAHANANAAAGVGAGAGSTSASGERGASAQGSASASGQRGGHGHGLPPPVAAQVSMQVRLAHAARGQPCAHTSAHEHALTLRRLRAPTGSGAVCRSGSPTPPACWCGASAVWPSRAAAAPWSRPTCSSASAPCSRSCARRPEAEALKKRAEAEGLGLHRAEGSGGRRACEVTSLSRCKMQATRAHTTRALLFLWQQHY
jgi:NAD(P)H-hydrate repair Nnr-like enzyme with NAD(P)H-hydrate dehydratase domain